MRRRSSRSASRRRPSAASTRAAPAVGALDAGLRLLGLRAHSRFELKRKLARRGYEEDELDSALRRLAELGYLDDRSFAQGFVRRRAATRGPLALSAELAARGVNRAEADAAVAGFDAERQLDSARRLAERLYASRRPGAYREMLDQVGSRLIRRGFSATVARAACRAVYLGTVQDVED